MFKDNITNVKRQQTSFEDSVNIIRRQKLRKFKYNIINAKKQQLGKFKDRINNAKNNSQKQQSKTTVE